MPSNLIAVFFVICLAPGLVLGPGASAELLEAVGAYFGQGCVLEEVKYRLSKEEIQQIASQGVRFKDIDGIDLWLIRSEKVVKGYAFVDDVKGKARNITYTVIFNPKGEIQGIDILKYRESHGGEVASSFFRDQFTGKSAADPIAIGRDIRNITGATISCRSVTGGVKSLSVLFEFLKKNGKLPL